MGFECILGGIEVARLDEDAYDLVLLSAVLEHLHDPLTALRNVLSALRPGGCAIIDVPNFGSAEVRIFRRDWSHFSIAHLFYFTQDALSRALRKTGFIPEVFACKSSELSFGYSIARRMGTERGAAITLIGTPFQFVLNALNQSGELFCRARKPP
jgi:SAM-dependent methyltransferase